MRGRQSDAAQPRAASLDAGRLWRCGSQAAGQWSGRADVLLRIEKPSKLGSWSYEIVNTKLSQETKGSTLLQLSLYADLLAAAQGAPPEDVYVVSPETGYEAQPYRVAEFAAYYRWVRQRLERAVAGGCRGVSDVLRPRRGRELSA